MNVYDVTLDLGPLGEGRRQGRDSVWGTLALKEDGTYRGVVKAFHNARQVLVRVGPVCPGKKESLGWQELRVVGMPRSGFGDTHVLSNYFWSSGGHDGGYLSLEFFPATAPRRYSSDPCQTEIETDASPFRFLPFNDAQWTIRRAGYGIALPRSGLLKYMEDALSADGDPVGFSVWYVDIERKTAPP